MKKKVLSILLIICIILPMTFAEETVDSDLINDIINMVENYYKYNITKEELIDAAYKGITDVLDKHSTYFTKKEYKEFLDSLEGKLIGIGVFIEPEDGYIKVISPIEGSPASKVGMLTGDLIIKVDDIDIKDIEYNKSVDMIKGEENTKVKITVLRRGKEIDFDIIRQVINAPDITYEVRDEGIGYIRIIQFGDNVAREFEKALKDLQSKNIKGLIIDLRNNPGGYLDQVAKIADWFLDKGQTILSVDYRVFPDEEYKAEKDAIDIPVAVIINGGSASASEILAGAIKYNKKGTIVGETSYGKGTVQNLMSLKGGSAIKLTTAEYLSAYKKPVNKVGIKPDYVVPYISDEDKEALSHFVPMIDDSIAHYGKKGLDVYGAQQRLQFLGYDVDITGEFNEKLAYALTKFQKEHNIKKLYAIYPETKEALDDAIKQLFDKDPQYDKAFDIIKQEIK